MVEPEKLLRLPASPTLVAAEEVHLETGESLLEVAALAAALTVEPGRQSPQQ